MCVVVTFTLSYSTWGWSCSVKGCPVWLSSVRLRSPQPSQGSKLFIAPHSPHPFPPSLICSLLKNRKNITKCKHTHRTLKYLQRAPSLVPTLSKLCHAHSITPFLQLLLSSLLEDHFVHLHGNHNHGSASLDTIMGLLDEIYLEEDTVAAFLR